MKLFICKDLFRILQKKDMNDKHSEYVEIDISEFSEHISNCGYCSKYFADLITDVLSDSSMNIFSLLKRGK